MSWKGGGAGKKFDRARPFKATEPGSISAIAVVSGKGGVSGFRPVRFCGLLTDPLIWTLLLLSKEQLIKELMDFFFTYQLIVFPKRL